jgi:hypothetical protein
MSTYQNWHKKRYLIKNLIQFLLILP